MLVCNWCVNDSLLFPNLYYNVVIRQQYSLGDVKPILDGLESRDSICQTESCQGERIVSVL